MLYLPHVVFFGVSFESCVGMASEIASKPLALSRFIHAFLLQIAGVFIANHVEYARWGV